MCGIQRKRRGSTREWIALYWNEWIDRGGMERMGWMGWDWRPIVQHDMKDGWDEWMGWIDGMMDEWNDR